jgi:predicted kinase
MRAVIVDMDGTLSDVSRRVHHLQGEKDWKAFHDAMLDDEPIEPVATLVRILARAAADKQGIEAVILVTARHDDPKYAEMTREWLEYHDIPVTRIYMRKDNDIRPDHMIKKEILEQIISDGYEPFLAIDDRKEVVRMWRKNNIVTLQCAPDDPGASPWAGQPLLHMLVGPCGAGKSEYVQKNYQAKDVISTDSLRMELYGNLGQSPEALARVWRYTHNLIKARLDCGVFTVLDATNLDHEDRQKILDLVPSGLFVWYIVIDRPYDEKLKTRGWRSEEMMLKQDRKFRKELSNILAGDDNPYVVVHDKRKR